MRHKNKSNGTNSMMNSKFWDKNTKQAYMTIKKRAQEMGTNLDGCPDEIVELQSMFNYTSANKANKKRIKKLQKQIDKSGVYKPNSALMKKSMTMMLIMLMGSSRRGNSI